MTLRSSQLARLWENMSTMSTHITLSIILMLAFCIISVSARSVSDATLHGNQLHNHSVSNTRNNKNMRSSYTIGNQNRCKDGWQWFNNKCLMDLRSRRSFSEAIELCKGHDGSATLPTIHSEDENEFLRHKFVDVLRQSPFWLYAKHNHQYNKTDWLDKSRINYTKWDNGQPSDKLSLICLLAEDQVFYMKKAEPVDGQTECVSFWNDGTWGTQVGCRTLLPVVCEKKLPSINRLAEDPNGRVSLQYEQQSMSISGSAQHVLISRTLLMMSVITALNMCFIDQRLGSNHRIKS